MRYRQISLCIVLLLGGCSAWNPLAMRSQSPDNAKSERPGTRLVGDLAAPYGMRPMQVDGISLVTGLVNTGSDAAPSPQRAYFMAELKRRNVDNPSKILHSQDTALVVLRAKIPPGVQEGDRFDVEVWTPQGSETKSLRSGDLVPARLKQMAVLSDHRIHEGHAWAICQGPVMVDPSAKGEKGKMLLTRGRILGGGVALKSRPLDLVLKPDHTGIANSARIEKAVNRRFHTYDNGVQIQVATARNDEQLKLAVHPTYKNNINRYMRVVLAIAVRERMDQRLARIERLSQELLDPTKAASVALKLEAIGNDAIDALRVGIKSSDPEVQFYSAEALAYLGRQEAAEPLAKAAKNQPAFRVFALTALSALDDYASREQLCELMSTSSAETRYGAFRALWAMRPDDPIVLGESVNGQFSYHVLRCSGPPMIHVTRSRRPEVVLFGENQQLLTPLLLQAGNQVIVKSEGGNSVAVSRYAIGQKDQRRVVTNRVDDVIRAIIDVGGTYPDVVQALQAAKAAGVLTGRFEVDALPQAGRVYQRGVSGDELAASQASPKSRSPMPSLFSGWGGRSSEKNTEPKKTVPEPADSEEKSQPVRDFFAKMTGRGRS